MADDFLEINDITEEKYNKRKKKYDKKIKPTLLHEVFSYIFILIIAFLVALFLLNFVIFNALVPSSSMVGTIDRYDKIIGFRLSYMFSEPQRGDIVIFKFPDNEKEDYIKRIIGMPGDTIHLVNNQLYINDELINEPYIYEPMNKNEDLTFVVPDNSYFMMGDNRNISIDSRYWNNHFVSRDKIEAKAIFRYYSGTKKFIDFGLIK